MITGTIWIWKKDLQKFIIVTKILKEDGSGILGMSIEGRDYLKENKFEVITYTPAAEHEFFRINVPIELFTALQVAF